MCASKMNGWLNEKKQKEEEEVEWREIETVALPTKKNYVFYR